MAKEKKNYKAIAEIEIQLKNKIIQPVYYLAGDDDYSIDHAVDLIFKTVEPLAESDFNISSFYGEDTGFNEILSLARTFPLGADKRIIIVKHFEKCLGKNKDSKKQFIKYINEASDFTILICTHNEKIQDEAFITALYNKGYIFEAKELKGISLRNWIVEKVKLDKRNITADNAQLLIDIAGENRNLIESQLEKIYTFLGEDVIEITYDSIKDLATELKEYTIFNLYDAIADKNKINAFNILNNMLIKGTDLFMILNMLGKLITTTSKYLEVQRNKSLNEWDISRKLGVLPFQLNLYKKMISNYSINDLANFVEKLVNVDLTLKTTQLDPVFLANTFIIEVIPS